MAKFGISYRTESGLTVGLHDSYFGTPRESSNVNDEDARRHHSVRESHRQRISQRDAERRLPVRQAGLPAPAASDLTAHVYVNNLLDEGIYYAEYTSVNVNSIPGRPGRAVFVGVTVGF